MLRIRLRRVGKKGQAYYRVVVADQRFPRDGRFLESLGAYDPHMDPPTSDLNLERAREWIAKGAQPSEAAAKILRRAEALNGATAAEAASEAPSEAESTDEAPAEAETPAEAEAEAPAGDEAEPALATEGSES